ncbi:MAG: BamA/TamA family outer membrane protein, partial [Syntrophobacteraceae bacterium]|nr:BamA/TamA family outer membrane protein [Syntrophobacteraceae bacterium]
MWKAWQGFGWLLGLVGALVCEGQESLGQTSAADTPLNGGEATSSSATPDEPPLETQEEEGLPEATMPMAEDASSEEAPRKGLEPLKPTRYEWSPMPAIAFDTDSGVIYGAVLVQARFKPGYNPYKWRAQYFFVQSAKQGPDGLETPFRDYSMELDQPGLMHGRIRVSSRWYYLRTITSGYYGLGNDAVPTAPASEAPGRGWVRAHQYMRWGYGAKAQVRFEQARTFKPVLGLHAYYADIDAYEGSQLEMDAALTDSQGRPFLFGTDTHAAVLASAGMLIQTMDHEYVPSRGMYHEFSLRGVPRGLYGDDIGYLGATMHLRFFFPLLTPQPHLAVATRFIADALVGDVPFFELANAGAFPSFGLPGGSCGVRGVPDARYHGRLKLGASAELRTYFWPFKMFGQRFRLGAAAFVDTARVFAHLRWDPVLDGQGLGLKYGVGLGPRLQWGETVVVRLDFAYSPSATDANPDLPMGIYFMLG